MKVFCIFLVFREIQLSTWGPTRPRTCNRCPSDHDKRENVHSRAPIENNRCCATYLPVWMDLALYRLANPAKVLEAFMFSYNFHTVPAFSVDDATFEEHCCASDSLMTRPRGHFARKLEFHTNKIAFFQILILRLLPSVPMSSVDSYRIKRVQFFGRKVHLLNIPEMVAFIMFAINQQPGFFKSYPYFCFPPSCLVLNVF